MNSTFEHTTDTLSSGTVIHHWHTSNLPKATILLQHGFGDYSQRWTRDYPYLNSSLASHNFDVWAMDMHGHGLSPGQRSICNVSRAVDDHLELRKRIHNFNEVPLFLLGHSLGGLVTAASVCKDPSNLAGAVLLAPALADPMTPLSRRIISLVSKVIPTWQIPRQQSSVDALSSDTKFIEKWKTDSNVFHGQISFRLASTALAVLADLWSSTATWSVPTLIVHGNKDTYTAYDDSRRFFTNIVVEDKEFYGITDGKHDVLSDADHVRTWEHVLKWLIQRS